MHSIYSLPNDTCGEIALRDVQRNDLPLLFAFESDPDWRAMSKVKPRGAESFYATWDKIFAGWASGSSDVIQKSILLDGEVCGTIGCHFIKDRHTVGYGLGQAFWGKGIASEALGLLLTEISVRPLYATTAASNMASIRVLGKHGFVIECTRNAPESERCFAREESSFVLI